MPVMGLNAVLLPLPVTIWEEPVVVGADEVAKASFAWL